MYMCNKVFSRNEINTYNKRDRNTTTINRYVSCTIYTYIYYRVKIAAEILYIGKSLNPTDYRYELNISNTIRITYKS